MVRRGAAVGASVGLAMLCTPVLAQPALTFPVACAPDEDCYIQNFVDLDPGPGVREILCGPLTYDGHDGTDIALATEADLGRQVAVIAAATGVVRGVRDGMADIAQGAAGAPDVSGIECGNGVLIDHGDGWETQYCHLAQGSVAVAPGQNVAAGDLLGRIGLSGETEFPHLHFALREGGETRDPFGAADASCAPARPLWSDPVMARPGGVTSVGWATAVPDYADVRAGTAAEPIRADSPALVLFGLMFGGRSGDVVLIEIDGPGDYDLSTTQDVTRAQALFFMAGGRRAPEGGLPRGEYSGSITLVRDGAPIDSMDARLTVE